MNKEYEKLSEPTRERLENEFRNLLLVIPASKRLELEKTVQTECLFILRNKFIQFDEHWNVDVPTLIDLEEKL